MKLYRHKKSNAYLYLYTATQTETLEEMAVYKALYGEGEVWCRPLSMFMDGRFTAIQVHELTKEELDHLILMYQPKDG